MKNPSTSYIFKHYLLDGKPAVKFMCPKCGIFAKIDKEQYAGKVSVICPDCGFHQVLKRSN